MSSMTFMLPLLVIMCFIYPCINIVKYIIEEREKKLKTMMMIMGVKVGSENFYQRLFGEAKVLKMLSSEAKWHFWGRELNFPFFVNLKVKPKPITAISVGATVKKCTFR